MGGVAAVAAAAVPMRSAQPTPANLAPRTFTSPSSVPPSRRACVNRIPDTWSGSIAPNLHDRAPTKGAALNNRLRHVLLRFAALAVLASSLVFAGGALSSPSAHPKQTVLPTSYVASPPAVYFDATGGSQPCAPGLICYRPNEMKAIYDVPAGLDGSGQTIILVDAYGSPTIKADLAAFDAENAASRSELQDHRPERLGQAEGPERPGVAGRDLARRRVGARDRAGRRHRSRRGAQRQRARTHRRRGGRRLEVPRRDHLAELRHGRDVRAEGLHRRSQRAPRLRRGRGARRHGARRRPATSA